MSNSDKKENNWGQLNYKRKARKSFSIPKKRNARKSSNTKPMAMQLPSQGTVTSVIDGCPSTFADALSVDNKKSWESTTFLESSVTNAEEEKNSSMETTQISEDTASCSDDALETTNTSFEQMRSECLSLDEHVIPCHLSSSDYTDLGNPSFLFHGRSPVASSTPLPFFDRKHFPVAEIFDAIEVAVPKASSTMIEKVAASHRDVDLHLKSISPEQSLELPDICEDSIKRCETDHEDISLRLEPISSQQSAKLSDISENIMEESQEQHEDSITNSDVPYSEGFEILGALDENNKQNLGEDDDSKSNTFRDKIINKSNPNFRRLEDEANVINAFEGMVDSNSGEAQDMQMDSLEKKRKFYSLINKSISRYHRSSLGDMDEVDRENNFETVQGIPNEQLKENALDSNQPETAAHHIKRKIGKNGGVYNTTKPDASILNRSQSSTSLRKKPNTEGLLQDMNTSEIFTQQRKTKYQFKFTRLSKPNSSPNRKPREIVRNSSEVGDNCNGEDNFEEAPNIPNDIPKKAEKLSRSVGKKVRSRQNTSLRRKRRNEGKKLLEDVNKNESENSSENVQITNRHRIKIGKCSKNRDNYTEEDNLKEAQNIQIETPMRKGKLSRGIGIKYRNRINTSLKGKRRKEGKNLFEDMSQNESEDGSENVQIICSNKIKIGNFSKNTDNYNKKYNLNEDPNIQPDTPKKKGTVRRGRGNTFSTRLNTAQQRKHGNKAENSSKYKKKSDNQGNFKNVQDIQNEELQDKFDNNSAGTAKRQMKRKINKPVRVDNIMLQEDGITNKLQISTFPREKYTIEEEYAFQNRSKSDGEDSFQNYPILQNDRNKVGNSSEDNYGKEDYLKEAQSIQTDSPKKPYEDVGVKSKRSQQTQKSNWPLCCLKEYERKTFRTLKPVYRDDLPIDSLTMLNWGTQSKKNCEH